MFTVKKLTKQNIQGVKHLTRVITKNLTNPDMFMPFEEHVIDNMFGENSTLFAYGAFCDNTLVAMSLYDTNNAEFEELVNALGLDKSCKIAELGVCMTLPEYRGNNLMHVINTELVNVAKQNGFDYLVATAHPQNTPSNTSLKKLGMQCGATIIRAGHYERNVYYIKL
jgi:RimJ/RimL family protein N-acetyltransferase